eukprot:4290607-Prymnesium_polylepis.2
MRHKNTQNNAHESERKRRNAETGAQPQPLALRSGLRRRAARRAAPGGSWHVHNVDFACVGGQ